jgi:hypothetical protein
MNIDALSVIINQVLEKFLLTDCQCFSREIVSGFQLGFSCLVRLLNVVRRLDGRSWRVSKEWCNVYRISVLISLLRKE